MKFNSETGENETNVLYSHLCTNFGASLQNPDSLLTWGGLQLLMQKLWSTNCSKASDSQIPFPTVRNPCYREQTWRARHFRNMFSIRYRASPFCSAHQVVFSSPCCLSLCSCWHQLHCFIGKAPSCSRGTLHPQGEVTAQACGAASVFLL